MNLLIDSCFLAFVQCSCVGGSFRSGVQPPTGSRMLFAFEREFWVPRRVALFLCFRVGGSFRSGVQPPTGSRMLFAFGGSFRSRAASALFLCFRVGGSFRSGVQPPTGTRMLFAFEREFWVPRRVRAVSLLSRGWIVPVGGSTPDRLKVGKLHPSQVSPAMNLLIGSCFLAFVQCSCVGGSFRSGVQPPTGSRMLFAFEREF